MQKSNINQLNVLVLVGLMSAMNLSASASQLEIDDVEITENKTLTTPVTAWEHVTEGNQSVYSAASNLYNAGTSAIYAVGNLGYDVLQVAHGITSFSTGGYNFVQSCISKDEDQATESFKAARQNVISSYESIKLGVQNVPNTTWHIWETAKSVAFGGYDLGYGLLNYGFAGKLAIDQLRSDYNKSSATDLS